MFVLFKHSTKLGYLRMFLKVLKTLKFWVVLNSFSNKSIGLLIRELDRQRKIIKEQVRQHNYLVNFPMIKNPIPNKDSLFEMNRETPQVVLGCSFSMKMDLFEIFQEIFLVILSESAN